MKNFSIDTKRTQCSEGILEKRGYEYLPCDLTFKRYAENFRKNNYAEWVLRREGMKAYHDKVEPYIERDISKIEVGDIIIADGHVLNFQVINPFTGKPTRATKVYPCLDKSLSEGKTFHEFQKDLKPLLQKRGWWGEQIVVDTEGNAEKVQLGSMYRLKNIYRVNMQTAYMTGRYQTQLDNVDNRPYWEYVAVMDSSTRPEHAMLNGLVFRYDDPFWSAFYPPNGWNCRCRVVARSQKNLDSLDILPNSSDGTLSDEMHLVSKKSGEYKPVTVYTDPLTGKKIAPDVGWSHNPASGLVD